MRCWGVSRKIFFSEPPAQRHRATGSSPLSYRLNALGVLAQCLWGTGSLLDGSKQTTSFSVRNHTFVVMFSPVCCCDSLKEITIPADVTSIGDNAFSYSGLKKVRSLMQTPCGISSTVFKNVSNATLYVPQGYKAVYEAADYWKDFKKIMGPSYNLTRKKRSAGHTDTKKPCHDEQSPSVTG